MYAISLFEEKQVRRAWNAAEQKWVFAIVDVIAILTDSPNPSVYWRVMKKRLMDEGNETVTNCNGLKMTAADGKQRMTDVADTEQLLRLIQSVPSPKAEPFKRWLPHREGQSSSFDVSSTSSVAWIAPSPESGKLSKIKITSWFKLRRFLFARSLSSKCKSSGKFRIVNVAMPAF